MSKPTPGPWLITDLTAYRANLMEIRGEGYTLVATTFEHNPNSAANAALITAAPALADALDRALAALKEVYQEWGREAGLDAKCLYHEDPAVVAGLAALRQARGEATP